MNTLDAFDRKFREIALRSERHGCPVYVRVAAYDFTGTPSIDEHLLPAIRAAAEGHVSLFEGCMRDARAAARRHREANHAAFEADRARRGGAKP